MRIFAVFLLILTTANAFNYLVHSPVFGYSHMKFMSKIADNLAKAGHNVTIFQPYSVEHFGTIRMAKHPNVQFHDYHFDEKPDAASASAFSFFWDSEMINNPLTSMIAPATILFKEFEPMCDKIFQDKQLHQWIIDGKFDAFISETFDFCGLYLGDHLNQNVLPMFSAMKSMAVSYGIGEPSLINFMPAPKTKYGIASTTWDRINDIIAISAFKNAFGFLFDRQHKLALRHLDGKVNHWLDIIQSATFTFTNANPYIAFPTPGLEKMVNIGGFTISPAKDEQLSEEFSKILNLRKSTVLISFGTVIRSADMPAAFRNGIIEMTKKLDSTTFIWKYEEDHEEFFKRLPENVIVKKWVPQPALLADPRLNLFITHGGLGSIYEVAYSGKPSLMIPIFGDQLINAQMLSRHGGAEYYDKYELPNSEKLTFAISKVLSDPSYNKNAQLLAEILRNQPIDPKTTLVKHCEFAARFGRLETLSPYNVKYNFIEYYSLDAIFVISLVVFLTIFVGLKVVGLIFRRVCSSKGKSKSE